MTKTLREIILNNCVMDKNGIQSLNITTLEQSILQWHEEDVKKSRKEWEKELMAELRDPNGTIWEHAKQLQDENDRLEEEKKKWLEHYTEWLLRRGYTDDDVWCEGRRAVDMYLSNVKKALKEEK